MESREDCLHEASECDRLAQLANTQATRALLAVAAFQWRKLAEKAAERQKTCGPWASETMRPNQIALRVLAQRGVRTPAGRDRWAPPQVSRLLAQPALRVRVLDAKALVQTLAPHSPRIDHYVSGAEATQASGSRSPLRLSQDASCERSGLHATQPLVCGAAFTPTIERMAAGSRG